MLMLVLVRDHYVWSSHVRCTPLQYAGALSVYLMHILYHHLQFFSDIERENTLYPFPVNIRVGKI